MRIGLFPSANYSAKKDIDPMKQMGDSHVISDVLALGKGVAGSQQVLCLDGASILLRKVKFR